MSARTPHRPATPAVLGLGGHIPSDEDSGMKRQNCRCVKADSSGSRAGRCVCGEMGTDSSVSCWNLRGQGTARLGTPGRDNGLEVGADLLGTPNGGVDRGVGREKEECGR